MENQKLINLLNQKNISKDVYDCTLNRLPLAIVIIENFGTFIIPGRITWVQAIRDSELGLRAYFEIINGVIVCTVGDRAGEALRYLDGRYVENENINYGTIKSGHYYLAPQER